MDTRFMSFIRIVGRQLLPLRQFVSKRPLGIMRRIHKMMYIEKNRQEISLELYKNLTGKYNDWISELETPEIGRDLSGWRN